MIDLILKSIAYSSSIALMASGITIIYIATRTFNFAHASMVSWGFLIMFAFYSWFGGTPYYYVLVAAAFSGFLGIIIYYSVNRRLLKANASGVTLMMSTLGVDLVLFAAINLFADYLTNVYKVNARLFFLELKDISFGIIGGVNIRAAPFVSILVVVLVITLLHTFLTKTTLGTAMRATIENTSLAMVLGVNPEIVYVLSWFLGGALAGLGGALLSLIYVGRPEVGMEIIVTMFAGSIVGGLYSIFGSLLGGFLVGLSEYLGITFLSLSFGGWILAYKPLIPLAVMVLALLIYPQGISGISLRRITVKSIRISSRKNKVVSE
jgi:branched-chain amino acid transport system permease protein